MGAASRFSHRFSHRFSGIVALAALGLFGCTPLAPEPAHAPEPAPSPTPDRAPEQRGVEGEPQPALEPAAAVRRPAAFERETLYELLVAELALRQGDFTQAYRLYAGQARGTRDAGVIAQAVRLSLIAAEPEASAALAELWVEVAPNDPEARQASAMALIRAGRLESALSHLAVLHDQVGSANFAYLAAEAAALDPAVRVRLLDRLEQLHARFVGDPGLAYARAVLLEQAGRPRAGLDLLDTITETDLTADAALLKARLLERAGMRDAAIAWLEPWIIRGIDPARMRFTRGRMLVSADRLSEAEEEFRMILGLVGEHPEVLLSLSLLAADRDRLDASRQYLERLLATGRRPDAAHYYLGELAQAEGDPERAVAHFERVMPGPDFERAQGRAGLLMLRQGPEVLAHYMDAQRAQHSSAAVELWLLESRLLGGADDGDAALEVLDRAVADYPDDLELRYSRAFARKSTGDLRGLEEDLRHVLERDPVNAMALNALGYVLADRTARFHEAKELIEQAVAIHPEEPAYIDSLGWVEYRLGNHERALELLEWAFTEFPDHEIAAHFGEVLWVTGEREAALDVWRLGLELEPDSSVLTDTMSRLLGLDGAMGVRLEQMR